MGGEHLLEPKGRGTLLQTSMTESRSVSSLQRSLHPAIVPFVEECLRNDKINCQGGILAVTGVKTR